MNMNQISAMTSKNKTGGCEIYNGLENRNERGRQLPHYSFCELKFNFYRNLENFFSRMVVVYCIRVQTEFIFGARSECEHKFRRNIDVPR